MGCHPSLSREGRELDDRAVCQRGEQPEGLSRFWWPTGQEAGGEDRRCTVGQAGEVSCEACYGCTTTQTVLVGRHRGCSLPGWHGEIVGDVAIDGIVNQGSDAACSDIDGRRIGGAVDDKEVDIGAASRFTGAGLDQELECGGCPSGLGKGLPD